VAFCKFLDFVWTWISIFLTFWTMVGLGLSLKNTGVDLDHKIWQFTHLWCWHLFYAAKV